MTQVPGRAPEKGLRTTGLTEDEIVQIKAAFEKGGPEATAKHVNHQLLRKHGIFDIPDECVASIAAFETKGIDKFVLQISGKAFDEKCKSLENFTRDIITRRRR